MRNIFLQCRIFSCLHTWKISRSAKTDRGRLMGMPFLPLKGMGKIFFLFLRNLHVQYVCIPRLGEEGRIQSKRIRERLFAAVNTPVDAKRHKYRWLLSRNRVSRLSFSRTISSNGTACQLLYTQFVAVDHDFAIVIPIERNLPWSSIGRRECIMCICKGKYYNCI